MKLVCGMPVRNEDWIVGLSARAVLRWVDHLVLLDHASTDRTSAICNEVYTEEPSRVTALYEPDPVWEEMRHRQRLLTEARALGATHLVMVDADEVLSGNLLPSIREHVAAVPEGRTMQLPWQCLRGGIGRVMTTGIWGAADVCMAFRDHPSWHWTARAGYDFHHRHPMGSLFLPYRPVLRSAGGLLHLQFVSVRRLLAKQALYKMTEVLRWPGRDSADAINQRYDFAVHGSQAASVAMTPLDWWAPYGELMQHLNLSEDAAPWQECEVTRLRKKHGAARFAGLDLFGVAA